MEGLTFEEAAELHPEQYQALLRRDFEHVLLGGESYRQTLDRASRKLDEAIEQHKGGRIALFAHTGTICILILHLMGALDAPELKPFGSQLPTAASRVLICVTTACARARYQRYTPPGWYLTAGVFIEPGARARRWSSRRGSSHHQRKVLSPDAAACRY